MNCIKRTCLNTWTISHTSVCTCLRTAVRNDVHCCTIHCTWVHIIFFCFVAVTSTFNKCCHSYWFSNFLTHDCTNLWCNRCATNWTCVSWSFSCGNCLSKCITSCISATTTVVSRKLCSYIYLFLIYFNIELLTHYSEEKSEKKTSAAYNNCSNNYTWHLVVLLLNNTWKSKECDSHKSCSK